VHAPEECLLDAIAMAIASDGEVTEDEIDRTVAVVEKLPPFHGKPKEALQQIVGEAFERFASNGRDASLAAIRSATLDPEGRAEVLLAAALVPATEAFMIELSNAIGASEAERAKVLEFSRR
jgi:tellurite resistance protein